MKRISADQKKRSVEIFDRLESAAGEIAAAIQKYNEAVEDAEAFRDEIASEQQDYISGRSEKWQESDSGLEYADWAGQWETESFEMIDDDLGLDHAERLDNLPTSVEGD